MLFEFVKEMPKPETTLRLDLSSLLGTLFFSWVILLLFPVSCKYLLFFSFTYVFSRCIVYILLSMTQVILSTLVYEKEQRLRIMMKMHGLGDGPYWLITYAYFIALSIAYMLCFVIFGSLIGNKKHIK